MITFRAGKVVLLGVLVTLAAACSREQQDWRSAEAADTIEAYGQFLQRHPDSELATQARARVNQLSEDRDWQRAGSADTADAYRQFLTQHPNGKWAQEARIRIENFSLSAAPPEDSSATGPSAATAARSPGGTPTPSRPANLVPGAHAVATPTRVATVSSTSPPSGYGVQLGAFSSEASATNQWHQLAARFNNELQGLSPHVVAANTSSGHLYRLQARVADEAAARAICDSLKKHSQACVPVLPR